MKQYFITIEQTIETNLSLDELGTALRVKITTGGFTIPGTHTLFGNLEVRGQETVPTPSTTLAE